MRMIGDMFLQNQQSQFNRTLIQLLELQRLTYAIGGSAAAMIYSEPRMTNDIDLMIQVTTDQMAHFVESVEKLKIYIDPLETIYEFNLRSRLPICIVDGLNGTKADVYVAQPNSLDFFAIRRRRRLMMYTNPNLEAWFLAPEDIILYKLDYFRQSEGVSQKHPIDIVKILAVLGNKLDLNYLNEWADKLGVKAIWQALRDEFYKEE